MNADFFLKFTKFKLASLVNAEDFADKLNYQWTSAFLVISTAIIAMRQYIFTPIQCMVPAEWPRPWEEYTENYCWIQSTYHVHFGKGENFPGKETRQQSELNYYQWVPFMLALEALLVYLPHVAWKLVAVLSGYNPNAMVKFAAEASTIDQDKKKKLVNFLARHIEKAMNSRRQWRRSDSCYRRSRAACYTVLPLLWFSRRSGTMLFALYITNKLVYAVVGVGHLLLMQSFLGFDTVLFGWRCVQDLASGREWPETRTFPRVTFCDVPHRPLGQWNVRSVQCVLPANLINEKIYIFLWFWTTLCICLTLLSTAAWLCRLLIYKNRQTFVKKYLRILNSASVGDVGDEREHRKRFVAEFLAHDGVFILRMIAANVGDVVTAEIVDEMYRGYLAAIGTADSQQQQQQQQQQLGRKLSSAGSVAQQRRVPTAPAAAFDADATDTDFLFGKKSIV